MGLPSTLTCRFLIVSVSVMFFEFGLEFSFFADQPMRCWTEQVPHLARAGIGLHSRKQAILARDLLVVVQRI